MKNHSFYKTLSCLFIISAAAYLVTFTNQQINVFRLVQYQAPFWLKSLGLLPLLLIPAILAKNFQSDKKWQQVTTVVSYLAIFFSLSPYRLAACYLFIALTAIYYLNRFVLHKNTFLFFILSTVLLYLPATLYTFQVELSKASLLFIILYKSCIALRLIAWIIDRRIYARTNFNDLGDFYEFIFCPIFFIFPGQIQYFLFSYFHESKTGYQNNHLRILLIALWGLFGIGLFSYLNYYFFKNLYPLANLYKGWHLIIYHFLMGCFWLIAVYIQQASGMSFQIALGRLLGHELKYDMHWPLLARSPLDYLKRHSSYVRDYIVELGLRPLALPLLRRGLNVQFVFPLAAMISYAYFILPQTGHRPDYTRSWNASFSLMGFLCLYLTTTPILTLIRSKIKGKQNSVKSIASHIDEKPLREWTMEDYLAWLLTMVLLAASKGIFGWAMNQ